MENLKILPKNKISKIPGSPGIYFLKNKNKFLYIGKATNLKERVKNHFQQPNYRDNLFNGQVNKIGYIKTDSEIEALILEAKLIKKYQPKYNVMWRDDRNYFFVGITKEPFPKIFITHQPKNLKSKVLDLKSFYIGPFVDGTAIKETLKVLRKIFPYRSCNFIPKRPCLWHDLNRCPAPCLLGADLYQQLPNAKTSIQKESKKNAKNIAEFLRGGKYKILKELFREMKKTSAENNFEKAAETRDKIRSFERILSHAKIFSLADLSKKEKQRNNQKTLGSILGTEKQIHRIEAYDVSNIQGKLATGSMVVFVNGKPDKNSYRKFKIKLTKKPNDVAMIKEILMRRFRHKEWLYPDLVLIDGGLPQLNIVLKVKSQIPKIRSILFTALAKKENKLYLENQKKTAYLDSFPNPTKFLILQLRDEAHRFAIAYHKKLRQKSLLQN